jgi:hypothetical protein
MASGIKIWRRAIVAALMIAAGFAFSASAGEQEFYYGHEAR